MPPGAEVPLFDPRVVQGVMKLGGKKKLDAFIAILNDSGPLRLQDLKEAAGPAQAKAAAAALKASAGRLGLARVEDLCDQVLGLPGLPPADLRKRLEAALEQGRKELAAHRGGL